MWKEYGFSIGNENVSLVSIVIYDPDFNQTFTGHTGVLIKQAEDVYLYVEKLAFEQPYQAILVSDTDQLLDLLAEAQVSGCSSYSVVQGNYLPQDHVA